MNKVRSSLKQISNCRLIISNSKPKHLKPKILSLWLASESKDCVQELKIWNTCLLFKMSSIHAIKIFWDKNTFQISLICLWLNIYTYVTIFSQTMKRNKHNGKQKIFQHNKALKQYSYLPSSKGMKTTVCLRSIHTKAHLWNTFLTVTLLTAILQIDTLQGYSSFFKKLYKNSDCEA